MTPQEWAPWPAVTHWAVPVWTPEGPFVLRLEDERVVLHPRGDPRGYVVARGVTRWPDARWNHEAIRVVWSTQAGVIESRHLALDASRVDLREPPETEPMPMPSFEWLKATIAPHSAQEIARWPITSLVRTCEVELTGRTEDIVHVDHSKAGEWPIGFAGLLPLPGELPPETPVPGIRLFSRSRALAIAGWLAGLEPVRLEIDANQLILEAGLEDRWLLANLDPEEASAAATAFASAREQAGGLQFIAVVSAPDAERLEGFWLLRDLPDG